MIRRLFWLSTAAGAGYAGYMVWRWMRVQNKPSPTLERALAGRLYDDVGTPPAAPVRPSADASSPEAPQPRRIVTRVHRGAPPSAPKSDAPDTAETTAAPAEDESAAPAAEPAAEPVAEPSQDDPRTNINQADEATLVALPGIGPTLARRIITYRDEHGPFASVEQLENVPGIRRNLDEFRHLVTV